MFCIWCWSLLQSSPVLVIFFLLKSYSCLCLFLWVSKKNISGTLHFITNTEYFVQTARLYKDRISVWFQRMVPFFSYLIDPFHSAPGLPFQGAFRWNYRRRRSQKVSILALECDFDLKWVPNPSLSNISVLLKPDASVLSTLTLK